jgi:hypothetical protein
VLSVRRCCWNCFAYVSRMSSIPWLPSSAPSTGLSKYGGSERSDDLAGGGVLPLTVASEHGQSIRKPGRDGVLYELS